MKKRANNPIFLLLVLMIITLSGCDLPWSVQNDLSNEEKLQTQVAGTITAMQGSESPEIPQEDSPAPEEHAPIPTQTETLAPTTTLTATITLTPTSEKTMVSVSVDTNCRSGPGTIYDYIGALFVGEQAEVVGQSADGQYWIIKNPDRDGECWLWDQYAEVVGQTAELTVYTPPPTPTPVFDWVGEWMLAIGPTAGPPTGSFFLTITVDDNVLNGYFDLGGGVGVTINGTISNDYLTVSGNWVGPTNEGTFEFFALGVNQFQGNYTDGIVEAAWCGYRSGAGVPSPCYKN